MRLPRPALPVLLALAALGAVAATPARDAGADREVRRIRAHFDSVLVELDARGGAPGLTLDQRARRAVLLSTLRAYRDRGVFPHNYDFPGEAVPYFVDRKTGTLCAVAHLLASTGRRDIVDRVARADNNVRVMDLAEDTALAGWLRANGLTLAEAARIQMPYMIGEPATRAAAPPPYPVVLAAFGGALGSVTTSALNLRYNADGHSRLLNLLGVTTGVATTGFGLVALRDPGVPRGVSVATAAVGGLGIALSSRSMHRRTLAERASRAHEAQAVGATASIAPYLPVTGGGAGMSVSLRF